MSKRKTTLADCETENMTWQQKSDLIQKDPVTCGRDFEHMVKLFIKDVMKSDEMPIGETEWNFNKEIHLIYTHYFG